MIILTGASGGIGRAILQPLATLDTVVAIYRSTRPEVSDSSRITLQQLDLSREREVAEFAASMKGRARRITLIHAAAQSRNSLAAQFKTEDWSEVIDVNLRGNFLLTRELLVPMIQEKWGRIIHFSSVAGVRGVPGTLAYAASKTGLLGLSRVLATEHARFGITSNVLLLGYFNTGLIETLGEKARKAILEAIPSRRLGDAANIVNAVEFLIKSDYVNGGVIPIDGGI